MDGYARGDAAAGDPGIDGVAHLRFEHFELARQVHGNFRLAAVHGAQLDGDLETVAGALAAAVAGHGFHYLK